MPQLPRDQLLPLQEVAARILETKNLESEPSALARELLVGFHDVCLRHGQDGLLAELDLTDDADAAEHPDLRAALATRLSNKAEFDPRGPRNAKPAQLALCVVNALGVELVDPPARTITLSGAVRSEVAAALARAIEPAFAVPKLRDDIVAAARPRVPEEHHVGFEKLVAQLDDTGARFVKQPKVSLDIVQATQQLLGDARHAVIERALNPAIDRAKEIIARTSPEAAERIDQPITRERTPRQVAIHRVVDPRASKVGAHVVHAVLGALGELAQIAWQAEEKATRPYAASQAFAVGELIEHPKFGKGTVVAISIGKMDVEFEHGKATLVQKK
ncbi:MAG: hypothetical protein JNL83_22205 [Myxococcales bacterium]|nr:hypothetical protein [Myxococcales bacterium]